MSGSDLAEAGQVLETGSSGALILETALLLNDLKPGAVLS